MQYKTIVLELIQQRPMLHEQLRSSNTLLSTVNRLATLLRDSHLAAIEQLRQARPDSASLQLASEAMEIALDELQQQLPPDPETGEAEALSLDEAMQFLRRHTPPG